MSAFHSQSKHGPVFSAQESSLPTPLHGADGDFHIFPMHKQNKPGVWISLWFQTL